LHHGTRRQIQVKPRIFFTLPQVLATAAHHPAMRAGHFLTKPFSISNVFTLSETLVFVSPSLKNEVVRDFYA